MKHYTDQELVSLVVRCQKESERLQNNIDDIIEESLDIDLYDLLWLDEFQNEVWNEHTNFCMKASQYEIVDNAIRLINKELKRRI